VGGPLDPALSPALDRHRIHVLQGGPKGQHDPLPAGLDRILGRDDATVRMADPEEVEGRQSIELKEVGHGKRMGLRDGDQSSSGDDAT